MGEDTRGEENQPADDTHFTKSQVCKIVLWEQRKHRTNSRANGSSGVGYAPYGMRGGHETWQSHHIVCISAMGVKDRSGKDDKTILLLEDSLYITDWNINDPKNMMGLPMYRRYKVVYGEGIDAKKLTPAARTAAYAAAKPQNLPAHDIDHNTKEGYTDEVILWIKTEVWNKFNYKSKDHEKNAEWLKTELEKVSDHFQDVLVKRGARKGAGRAGLPGTVGAWQGRMKNPKAWSAPFSMGKKPSKLSPGISESNLAGVFDDA